MTGTTNAYPWQSKPDITTYKLTAVGGSLNGWESVHVRGGVAQIDAWYTPSSAKSQDDIIITGAPKPAFKMSYFPVFTTGGVMKALAGLNDAGNIKMVWSGDLAANTQYRIIFIYPYVE